MGNLEQKYGGEVTFNVNISGFGLALRSSFRLAGLVSPLGVFRGAWERWSSIPTKVWMG